MIVSRGEHLGPVLRAVVGRQRVGFRPARRDNPLRRHLTIQHQLVNHRHGTRGSQVFETPTVNRWLVVLPCNDQRAAAKWRSMEQQWMGQSARDMGVRIAEGVRVTGFELADGGVEGV